ncbi:DUF1232 domain-containing protein [candidate division WOR-3 bacterium]|nr:DUF1232 domain-containing protein [candidate division WOR-3 bacterium]
MENSKFQVTEDFLKENSQKIKEEDLELIVEKADDIEDKVKKSGPLSRFYEDIKLSLSMIKDYTRGKYKAIPFWALSSVAFTVLYILNPVDIFADPVPFLGLIDDVTLIGICLYMVEKDLKKYRIWKSKSE